MTRRWLRWLPAAVVPVMVVGGALALPLQAGAAVKLPTKTPEQVLAMIGHSSVTALSGTLEQTSQLGLLQLPNTGSSSKTASALDLLTGTHTARVYLDGPTNTRVQVMDTLAERDVVRHGNDVWLYNSKGNTATHMTLPAHAKPEGSSTGEVQTPAQLAHRFLAAVGPTTTVSLAEKTRVAGHTAYDVVLRPRSTSTLVESVSIAVDSQTGLPLKVDVRARGQHDPAFEIGFTDVTLQKPAASLFAFTPPHGATVKHQALPGHRCSHGKKSTSVAKASIPQPTVIGTGWDAIVEMPATSATPQLTSSPLLAEATTAVPGGRLLSTSLVNVLVTTDGRVLAGSVPLDRLQAAAAAR